MRYSYMSVIAMYALPSRFSHLFLVIFHDILTCIHMYIIICNINTVQFNRNDVKRQLLFERGRVFNPSMISCSRCLNFKGIAFGKICLVFNNYNICAFRMTTCLEAPGPAPELKRKYAVLESFWKNKVTRNMIFFYKFS